MKTLVSFGSRKKLDPEQVDFLKAEINYTFIYLTDGTKILSSTSIGILETRLKSFAFCRPNRSLLVNTRFIKMNTIEELVLKNNEVIKISRRRQKQLLKVI